MLTTPIPDPINLALLIGQILFGIVSILVACGVRLGDAGPDRYGSDRLADAVAALDGKPAANL